MEMNTPINNTSSGPPLTSPPHPELAFRVGVVGHRPNRLKEADMEKLSFLIHDMLKAIKESAVLFKSTHGQYFEVTEPVLHAISPLAEGTDRLFAENALSLGYELCCVLPFYKEEFEKDFLPGNALEENSLDRFNKLLDQASTRFELDGSRKDNALAYGLAGDVVVNQSDLLIVVWDGVRQRKQGGTEETMDAAIRMGVQVIWICAMNPHNWQFVDGETKLPESVNGEPVSPEKSFSLNDLKTRVKSALDLPMVKENVKSESKIIKADDPKEDLQKFYSEKKPEWRISGFIWKSFRDLLGNNKFTFKSLKEEPFEESVLFEWSGETTTPVDRIVNFLRPYYAWIDKPAVMYSDKYRAAFVMIFLLAAFSVGMALLPITVDPEKHPWVEIYSITAELISISVIAIIYILGRIKQWHKRWLDYRIGAELIRHLRLIAPLGGKRPYPQVPAHWSSFGKIGSTWMTWYVQAIERKLGLPNTIVDPDYLKESLIHIKEYIKGQINFHETNYKRCYKIEDRLHTAGLIFLGLTFFACLLHLIHALHCDITMPEFLTSGFLTFVTGFFPALGAAIAGINSQGEFRRVAKRSEVMNEQLKLILKKVEDLETEITSSPVPGVQYSAKVTSIVSEAGRIFVNEVLDWRVIFLDQPLKA